MNRLGAAPRTVFVLGLLAALKAAGLVGIAQAIAVGITGVIAGDDVRGAVVLGLASGVLRAIITWASASYATRAAIGAKEGLRRELAERLLLGSDAGVGSAAVVGTVGLDELDNYYRTALPAVITAAVVPLLVGARILLADPISAIIIVITVPLVPVFMALVGMHSRDRADAASASLQRLSDHMVELARGLPVLVGLGRVDEQSAALRAVSERHRSATMQTLRTAFLSSLVLELISTISVAVVAVFVGVRLVNGSLGLEVGLIALVLAPECFAPFRELGSAFHSSQNGLAAMRAARALIDAPRRLSSAPARIETPTDGGFRYGRGATYSTSGLTVRYPDRTHPAVSGLSFAVPLGSIVSLEGESGSGKSSVLGVLAGVVSYEGMVSVPADVAFVPQHPHTVAATVWQEVRLYAESAGAVDDALATVGLTAVSGADPTRLSPGELRRLAFARGLVRVAAGAELLLLDEPTAHLDPGNAALIEAAIEGLRGRVTIVLASHEAGITRLADHRVLLGRQGGARSVEASFATAAVASADVALDDSGAVRELIAFLRPTGWRTLWAVLLGAGAALAAISLAAVSGWLIVRASEEPGMMYLMVAIVGVRFFGLARAGLRYAERLMTHSAVLGSVTELRGRLWSGLAARGAASRALATGSAALDYLVAAADRVRDLVPRVILPPAVALVTAVAAIVAVALLHAPAVPLLLVGLAVSIVTAPVVALLADRSAAQTIDLVRSTSVREFTAMVGAADELRANGLGARMVARLAALDDRAGRLARSSAWALGLGNAIVVLAGTSTAILMLTVADDVSGAVLAVLVLLPLGLIEPLTGLVDAVQQWPALSAALRRVRSVGSPVSSPVTARAGAAVGRVRSLELRGLAAGWSSAPTFSGVNALATPGDWIVVEGQSGAGKSTLLATILGYLPAASGALLINGVDARTLDLADLRSHIAWCPQESHLFDSTIRGNLLLARARDDRPSDAEMQNALETVGLGPLLGRLAEGLDAHVGSAGDRLSGGERQRLAVARTLLTRSEVVLLDEPTAHLDARSAEALMRDLRSALRDRIVVLVSHHGSERVEGDVRVRLGAAYALVE